MEEKICQIHQDEMVSVCFFEGCTNYFLCSKCIRSHPDSHELSIKSIMSLMRKDDWIKSTEEQRDLQIAQMNDIYKAKDILLDENKKKLQTMVDEIIDYIRKRLSQWTLELENLDTKQTFAKLEDTLNSLGNINFREGDIYDKVDKSKQLTESILPDSKEVCKQVQDAIDGFKIDQIEIDASKKEMIELLESIYLKDLFALSNSKRQKNSEQLNLLRQEYESFKQEKIELLNQLNKEINHLKKAKDDLQAQLDSTTKQSDQLLELNNDYQQKIESLTVINEELKEESSMFKAELDTVVAAKLKLHKDFENLILDHNKLRDKYCKSGLLSEDSLIIRDDDVGNIRNWIPIPINFDESFRCRLHFLYQATQDGFKSEAFYKKCDGKSPTIAFIKSKEHGRVFGGYTTKNWQADYNYITDKEAFLFSLTHQEKYPIKHPEKAIYAGQSTFSYFILAFGAGYDICIYEGCNTQPKKAFTHFPYSYECSRFKDNGSPGAKEYLTGGPEFLVEEIEVYQVVWSSK